MLAESDTSGGAAPDPPISVARACITWRGDSNYVATLVESEGEDLQHEGAADTERRSIDGRATMSIWDGKTLQLHADGEAAAGLAAVGAWQPNGRHLYAAQHTGPRPRVLLFERNGLQHGGFDIPVPGALRRPCQPLYINLLSYGKPASQVWSTSLARRGHR